MSLMSNLYKMGSALNVSHTGLYVTSHNMANSETKGYSRQRILQSDNFYTNVGQNGSGNMRVGMGVGIDSLEQIRNELLDNSYRKESSRTQYYVEREHTIGELETVMGEINGESFSGEMRNLWDSINTLSKHPEGKETRQSFLTTAVTLLDKVNNMHNKIEEYQYSLNDQLKTAVNDINGLSKEIARYNNLISKSEAGGDKANDYRDQRNLLLDQLSEYGEITTKEDISGQINVSFEGNTLIQKDFFNTIGLQYMKGVEGQSFVQPVWTSQTNEILSSNVKASPLYTKSDLQIINQVSKTDTGKLKGILTARGDISAKWDTDDKDIKGFIIPTVQKEMDILVNKIVNMMNSIVSANTSTGEPPYDLEGNNTNNELIFVMEDPLKGYTSGNIKVNQILIDKPERLALSQKKGDIGDNTLVEKMLTEWKNNKGDFSPITSAVGYSQNFETYYAELISRIGNLGKETGSMIDSQATLLNKIENDKQSISGVSMDEEMSNMIIYQHSYNAAAKIFNVIDGMLDTIINRM